MTEQHSREKVCDWGIPSEPRCEAPSHHDPGIESEDDRRARVEERQLSRRAAIVMGSAAAAGAVVPVEAMARMLVASPVPGLLLERMRSAIDATHKLRDIRGELAACQVNIRRMNPDSEVARAEQWRQLWLRHLQSEAETRAFSAANSMQSAAPDALKADVWKFAVTLHRHNDNGSLQYVEPDRDYWYRKRVAAMEGVRAGRARWATKA